MGCLARSPDASRSSSSPRSPCRWSAPRVDAVLGVGNGGPDAALDRVPAVWMRGQVALVGELVPYAAAGATGGASPSSAPAPTSYTFLDFGVAPGTIADAAFEHRVIVEAQLEL